MEIRVLKMFIDTIVKDRYHFLSPPEVYLADKHSPKVLQLYKLIKDGKVKTDDEAMLALYSNMPLAKEYKKVKAELVDKLEILLLGINPEKAFKTFTSKSVFYAFRSFFATNIVRQTEAFEAHAQYWYQRTLSLSLPIGINSISLQSYFNLAELSAYRNKPVDWLEYKKAYQEELDAFIIEKEIKLLDQEVILIMLSSESANYKFAGRIKKYFLKAKKLATKSPRFFPQSVCLNIGFRYGQASRNPQFILELTGELEKLLNNFPEHRDNRNRVKCAVYRMESHMMMREYEKGKQEVKNSIKYFTPGTYNWLAFLEYYFLMCMHAKNYEQALNIYFEVFKSEYFPNLNPEFQERWKYFEPYLNYILPEQFPKESFNLLGFLDEISYYTQHKGDNNITIMIGQIIVMLEMREFEKLASRTHYLKDYIVKYVDKKIYPRSFIFLKIVLKLFQNNFNANKVEEQTKEQFKKLLPTENNKLFSPEGIEIIPYDHLWPMILGKLKIKKNAG